MTIHSVSTAFDPSKHGFKFRNEFPPHSVIDWIDTSMPEWWEKVAGTYVDLAAAAAGIEGLGLCGGMCFASLDRYFSKRRRPPDTSPPAVDSALFSELVVRQMASLQPDPGLGLATLAKCMDWYWRPDEGSIWNLRHSVGHLTQSEEWPKIRTKLSSGIPTTICLVRGGLPTRDHQVVATGYTYQEDTKRLTISIYDPNVGARSGEAVAVTVGQKNSKLSSSPSSMRGFFHIPYDRNELRITEDEIDAVVLPERDDLAWLWPLLSGT